MTPKISNTSFDKGIIVEAEIQSAWLPFIYLSDKKITELTNSIIYKLLQSHYHLVQALRNSRLSIESMKKFPFDQNKQYYEFITNCNIDSMIYALNSLMDVVAKLLVKIYPEIAGSKPRYFNKIENHQFLESLENLDPATADIVKSFFTLDERKYVNSYCNKNKHEKAFFSSGSYFFFDTETDKKKPELVTGYNLKERYKIDNSNNKELEYYAQRLDNIHRDKICQLGKSISRFKGYELIEVDDNFLNVITMHSNKYFK
jgi:hypothetical protein